MASRLNPYLNFAGNARAALEFYSAVFGGEPEIMTYGAFSPPGTPGGDQVMHGFLSTASGFTLMAADSPPGETLTTGNSVTVSLSGDDAAELRSYWEQLADGGTVSVPLEKQMWGDEFGMCTDKFGVPWMVNIGAPAA